jgi:hypothetical protein
MVFRSTKLFYFNPDKQNESIRHSDAAFVMIRSSLEEIVYDLEEALKDIKENKENSRFVIIDSVMYKL